MPTVSPMYGPVSQKLSSTSFILKKSVFYVSVDSEVWRRAFEESRTEDTVVLKKFPIRIDPNFRIFLVTEFSILFWIRADI
jgi:hypothetical protein